MKPFKKNYNEDLEKWDWVTEVDFNFKDAIKRLTLEAYSCVSDELDITLFDTQEGTLSKTVKSTGLELTVSLGEYIDIT